MYAKVRIGQVLFQENAVYVKSCQEAQTLLGSGRWRDLVAAFSTRIAAYPCTQSDSQRKGLLWRSFVSAPWC